MGNKSSSSSSQMPPYLLGSGSTSRRGPSYCSGPFIAMPAFHHSATSLHHLSGTDSGYMTSPADSERWRAHNWKIGHSRLSLNDAFVVDGPPNVPPTLFPQPTYVPIPPPTLKQFKKWQKKQKKLLKKMGSMPPTIISPHTPMAPLLPYTRAFSVDNLSSQALDGYADVPVVQKRSWKDCKKVRKAHQAFGDTVPDIPPPPPKSTVSSGCSNGFALTDLRVVNSAPSTNTSDRSRLTSTSDRSSSLQHQKLSPVQLKNPSCELLQRARLSRSGTDVVGCTARMQQGNLVGRSSTDPGTTSAVINEETSSEIRCEVDDGRSVIDKPRATVVKVQEHPDAANFNGFDDLYGRLNNSINRDSRFSGSCANGNDDNSSERVIPIKITPEAKKILEKNAQLFPKSETNPKESDKVFSRDKTGANSFQQYTIAPSTAAQPNTPLQTPLGYLSLKRNADYGSTISSLTQSSNMKTEVSDIDFSWVNDVENRLEREIAFVKEDSRQQQQQQIPVRYFGMDLQHPEIGKGEVSVVSPEMTVTKPLEVFGECESRKELSQIHSDVRSKAAMFDTEAFRNERKLDELQASSRYRSRSIPRGNVYIPQPDYQNYDPISVDTSQNLSRYFSVPANGGLAATVFTSERNPCQYTEGCNIKVNGCVEDAAGDNHYIDKSNHSGAVPKQQYSEHKNEMLQRQRTYDATEYYVQNAARRNVEKPWRTSTAY